MIDLLLQLSEGNVGMTDAHLLRDRALRRLIMSVCGKAN
jgi:hypothetical protein